MRTVRTARRCNSARRVIQPSKRPPGLIQPFGVNHARALKSSAAIMGDRSRCFCYSRAAHEQMRSDLKSLFNVDSMNIRHPATLAFVMAFAATICMAGCATRKEFVATGGSRADGTVSLSYEYGMFQSPQEDQEEGVALASSTCAGWGYSGSQPFGGETQQCSAFNGYGKCVRWLVTRRYQCLGSPH